MCQIDREKVPTKYGYVWDPYWAAECICGKIEILDLEEVRTLTTFKCNHRRNK